MTDPFFDDFLSQSPSPAPKSSTRTVSDDSQVPRGADPLSQPSMEASPQPVIQVQTRTTSAALAATALPAAVSKPSIAESAVSQPSARAQQYFAFKVHNPVQGNEMLKPLTYFPIEVTVHMPPPDHEMFQRFVPLPVAPHHRTCPLVAGQRRNRWDGDATTEIKRRYSEMADIRQLLVLQYPMLIIPPLPPKSVNDNFNTYLQSQAQLIQQTRNMARFLRELGKMNDVMLFHELIPNLLQCPREKLSDLMYRVRDTISLLRGCNASLEEHRERKKGAAAAGDGGSGATAVAAETVAHIAAEGQKMVRGLVGALSSWMATPATGSAAQASKDREGLSSRVAAAYQSDSDVRYWNSVLEKLNTEKVAISQAAEALLKLIVADDEMYASLEDVSKALSEYSDALSDAESFAATTEASRRCGTLAFDISDLHKVVGDRRYVSQYEVLLFQVSYLEAAEDAIEFQKCLLRRKLETQLDLTITQSEKEPLRNYVTFVDKRLRIEFDHFFLNHQRKIRAVMKHMCEAPIGVFAEEERRSSVHPFVALIRTEAYSRFQ